MKASLAVLATTLGVVLACSGLPWRERCGARAPSLASIEPWLPLHAQLRFGAGERSTSAVVFARREGEAVVLVSLAGFGARLHTIRIAADRVEIDRTSLGRLGPPPGWVLDALGRAFFDPDALRPAVGVPVTVDSPDCGTTARVVLLPSGTSPSDGGETP